jgi:hypothetical protein
MKRLLVVGAIMVTAGLLPFAISPAGAVVFANPQPINITLPPLGQLYTPADLYPSNIAVSGFTGTVTDVNVTLCGFSATFPSDVNVMLVAPNGTNAMIMSDVGGNGNDDPNDPGSDVAVSGLNVTIDDAAANPLPADSALSSGTFRPVDDDINELPLNENPDEDQFPFPAPPTSSNVALSAFNGVNPNGTWALYIFDDFPAQPSDGEFVLPNFSCGWSIDVTSSGTNPTTTTGGPTTTGPTTTTSPPAEDVPPPADFDGDGDTDVSVFRPSGVWFVSGGPTAAWGTTGDIPVPGDYNGDGDNEFAVFRPSNGLWFVQDVVTFAWGASGDIPVPGDYDGDGDTDLAVFRPSSGAWFVLGGESTTFGTSGDIPVPGDYDGDGETDFAVFRPSTGTWFIDNSGSPEHTTVAFGAPGDIPVPADYDGDGDVNIAVFRPSNGIWFFRQGNTATAWGASGDIPVPGDYDGDGDAEVAVFRPSNGVWFVQNGPTVAFGTSGDVPLPLPDAIRRFFFPPL